MFVLVKYLVLNTRQITVRTDNLGVVAHMLSSRTAYTLCMSTEHINRLPEYSNTSV